MKKMHAHGTSNWPWSVCNVQKISKFPPPWNFKLTLSVYNGKKISKFPPPWNFKLALSVYNGKKIEKNPTPVELQITFECVQW